MTSAGHRSGGSIESMAGPACAICRACAELFPERWEAAQHDRNHTADTCDLLQGTGHPARGGLPSEPLAHSEFEPPLPHCSPIRLLSLAGDNGGGGTSFLIGGTSPLTLLGFRIWPVARLVLEVLAAEIGDGCLEHVLEVGAGTGVVGLSLAKAGLVGRILLTDSDDLCVHLLRANTFLANASGILVANLQLGDAPAARFNAVVASDVIYDPSVPERSSELLATARAALGPRGGPVFLGYQHRRPALTAVLFAEAQKHHAVVQELRAGEVPSTEINEGQIGTRSMALFRRLSVFRLELPPETD